LPASVGGVDEPLDYVVRTASLERGDSYIW
jgi:hypothetical protein